MRPGVHLRPDRLRRHAAVASELVDALHGVLRAAPAASSGTAELERLDTTVRRAIGELHELRGKLLATAEAAVAADAGAADAVRRAGP
jgi:hypothetical protein